MCEFQDYPNFRFVVIYHQNTLYNKWWPAHFGSVKVKFCLSLSGILVASIIHFTGQAGSHQTTIPCSVAALLVWVGNFGRILLSCFPRPWDGLAWLSCLATSRLTRQPKNKEVWNKTFDSSAIVKRLCIAFCKAKASLCGS